MASRPGSVDAEIRSVLTAIEGSVLYSQEQPGRQAELAGNGPFQDILSRLRLHWELDRRTREDNNRGRTAKSYAIQNRENLREHLPSSGSKRSFNQYLHDGALFDNLWRLCPGLLSLVAPLLTEKLYVLLSFNLSVLNRP